MTTPLFTVIIPTYNRAHMIAETLDSIEKQTLVNFEVFVVDDGSTDSTRSVVQSFANVGLITQENKGPGAARNLAADCANGEYLAFLDSDDIWFPWSLKTYANVIRNHNRPAFITGCPRIFGMIDQLERVVQNEVQTQAFEHYYASGESWLWYGVSSFVIRKDVFKEVGGFAEGRINGEDAELAMRLGTAPGFVHITSPPMFGYRQHDNNVTHDTMKSKAGIELLLAAERDGRFPGGATMEKCRARVISRHVRPFAFETAKTGDCLLALRLYRAVLKEAFREQRWKFILGLPAISIWRFLASMFRMRATS